MFSIRNLLGLAGLVFVLYQCSLQSPSSLSSSSIRESSVAANELAPAYNVVLLSAEWCGYCDRARSHLESRDIPFREFDVEKSDRGADIQDRLRSSGIPVAIIGERRIDGFNRRAYDDALDTL